MFVLNHINLAVKDPERSAKFYARFLVEDGLTEQLGDSLHLRNTSGTDIAFQRADPGAAQAFSHFGFLSKSPENIDHLLDRLTKAGVRITDDCTEEGFRSIKFVDHDGHECEVYWEAKWP